MADLRTQRGRGWLTAKKPWSPREIEMLRVLYPTGLWPAILKAFPSRTKAAIRCQAVLFGVRRQLNAKTPWTDAEKVILAKLYPSAPWPEICAAIPKHSKATIQNMAVTMRLGRDSAKKQSQFELIRTLRIIRRKSGIEQYVLADTIGVQRVQLAKWERGEQLPRLRGLFDWIDALDCRLEVRPKAQRASE